MRLCRTPLSTRDPAPATRSPSAMSSSCPRHWVPAACKIRQREPSNPIRRPPVYPSAWRGSGFRGRTAKLRGPFVCPGEAGYEADAGRCEHLLYRKAPPALGEVAVAYHGRNPFPTGLFPRAFSHVRPAAAVVAPRPVRDRNPARRRFYDHRSRNSGRSPPGASRELSQDEERRRAFLRKWRLKCKAVADSLEETGDRLFTFNRLPRSQWKSARTTNAIERLHEEFKRRIKTRTVLPSAETAAMLFWALLAAGQITMRKVDGWETLTQGLADKPIDLAASPRILIQPETVPIKFQ